MASGSDPRVHLLDSMRERLEAVDRLSGEVRRALGSGHAAPIAAATARAETLALEFKLLFEEFRRAADGAEAGADVARARDAFDATVTRLARSSAIGGGVLSRLVTMSRRLAAAVGSELGEPYLPSGRAPEPRGEGLRLRETV